MVNGNGVPAITEPWPVKDIVYVAIVGSVMLCAFLEWFLWLAAFIYCLVKVYIKADHLSVKILAIVMIIGFTALRAIFLPIMIVTLPLPSRVTQYFPESMVSFLQWFAFWSFAGLLTVPWLFCVYQLVTNSLGRNRRVKYVLDETTAPKVVIVMPCYKEVPDVLITAIDSITDCEYPPSCLHIFLSFDGDQVDELFLQTIEKLGVPLVLQHYPSSIDVTYRSCRITVSRFPHGGKRHCQKATFRLIDKVYTDYLKRNDNLFVLFIDSDCILDKVCIQNFMYEMELKPGSKHNMLAMTGVITSTTEKHSLITLLQDMEYLHGQLFERSVESGCGAVTCLPGALTILRFSAFRKMAKYYFADKAEQCDDLFDYGKCHLGEDRWLTHLFMIGARERYQIQMCTGAFCKTEAVQTYKSLIKQRRRWFLGFITNEVCMLTDYRLWKMYPILCIVRFMQNTIRTTALLFFIMVLSIITTSNKIKNLPVGFIAVSLGLNWLLMIYFGLRLGRYKAWLYPIMFIVNPFFNWLYMVYGIFTAGQRTWGGPRADAGTADANTTAQEAIEHAEATGDDLNIVPETFKPATEERLKKNHGEIETIPLQPDSAAEGLFAAAQQLPNGWYRQSMDSLPEGVRRNPMVPEVSLHPHDSWDSLATGSSHHTSVYMPRRVESMMGEEDQAKYKLAQESQREPGGAHMFSHDPHGGAYELTDSKQWTSTSTDDDLSPTSHAPIKDQTITATATIPSGHPAAHHSRNSSYRSSASVSPTLSPHAQPSQPASMLAIPEPAMIPGQRRSQLAAAQSSPLAQGVMTREPSNETLLQTQRRQDGSGERRGRAKTRDGGYEEVEEEIEMQQQQQQQQHLRVSTDTARRPKKKLTKTPGGSGGAGGSGRKK